MGDIVNIDDFAEIDISQMDCQALQNYLEFLRAEIQKLDTKEPVNMNSEAHEAWGDLHEELEDMVDEVLDLLDDLID